jgi:hypothetical protein
MTTLAAWPAIRLALAEAVPEDNALGVLARIAHQVLPIPTIDPDPNVVPRRNSPDARRTLVQLVGHVDRSATTSATGPGKVDDGARPSDVSTACLWGLPL